MDTDEIRDCWAVSLKGRQFDLREWANQFKPPHDPIVRTMRDGSTLLFSVKFDGLTDVSAFREEAAELIALLNGATSLTTESQPVEFEGVRQFDENGKQLPHKVHIMGTATIRIRASGTLTDAGQDAKPVPPIASYAQRLVAHAEASPKIARMVRQFSKSDDWGGIYKVFEHTEGICGGRRNMKRLFGEKGSQYERARSTANHHRHADVYCPDPPTPIREAKSLAKEAVMLALGEM